MSTQEVYEVALRIMRMLEEMGVPYELGGSLASSIHGVPRSTLDADIVADLRPEQVRPFLEALGDEYVANAEAVEASVRKKRSFNLIHAETMLKADIFPVRDEPYARTEFSRRVRMPFPGAEAAGVWCSSPEDIVLNKLSWYAAGGRVADRQWQDVLGVLRLHKERLDLAYMEKWAASLGVAALLGRAAEESVRG